MIFFSYKVCDIKVYAIAYAAKDDFWKNFSSFYIIEELLFSELISTEFATDYN